MKDAKLVIGWREWVQLEELGVPQWTKAKIDTGATTSSLHAYGLTVKSVDGVDIADFYVHPHQDSDEDEIHVASPVTDHRAVRSSNGIEESRPVISTTIRLGDTSWPIELTLTDRDQMGFRMLLGRAALRRHLLVDSARSFVTGTPESEAEVEP